MKNVNSFKLLRNQVNISNSAMPEALHSSGARICKVGVLGMSIQMGIGGQMIDNLIQRRIIILTPQLEAHVLHNTNKFDIEVVTHMDTIDLSNFGKLLITGELEHCPQSKPKPQTYMLCIYIHVVNYQCTTTTTLWSIPCCLAYSR